jgi:hypothetical protein
MSYGLFEHLAHTDESQRLASRKALALARVRADKSFGRFVAAAHNVDERETRLALVAGDLEQLVKQACADCGCEGYENVLDTVKEHLGFVVEARRPKMCPYHREVTDISLAAADPKAGFSAMAQHAWGARHCQGEWEGGCNFKPEMVTQTYWDQKREQAEQRRQEREQQRQQEITQQPVEEAPVDDFAEHDDFEFAPEPSAVGEGAEPAVAEPQMAMAASRKVGVTVPNPNIHAGMTKGLMFLENKAPGLLLDGVPAQQFLANNGGTYNGRPLEVTHPHPTIEDLHAQCIANASAQPIKDYVAQQKAKQQQQTGPAVARTAEALETVDVEKGGDTPSPKMDKRKWTPENVSFLDVEMDGSPHPTEHQDIAQPADYSGDGLWGDDGRFDQTNTVVEKQDVEEKASYQGDKAHGNWPSGGERSAVSSVDPDKNPIAEALLSEEEAQRAISDYRGE